MNRRSENSSRQLKTVFVAAGVTLLWMVSLFPLLSFAASNHRLVEAFSPDEAMQLNLLHGAVARDSFALDFGPYGHLGFNLILLILRVIPATDAHILYVGRGLGVFFAGATALLTFVWANRAYGSTAAWIAFTVVLVNQTLYLETAEINPDLVQLFFLMLALAFVVKLAEESRPMWLMLASIAAGLAFASKYSGLFVLPVATLVLMRRPLAIERPDLKVMILRTGVAVCAIVLLASTQLSAEWIALHLASDGHVDSPIAGRIIALFAWSVGAGGVVAFLLAAARRPWSWLRRSNHALAVVWFTAVMAAVFVATFVVASPYSLWRAAFVKGILGEVAYAVPLSVPSVVSVVRGIAVAIGWPAFCAMVATVVWLLSTAQRRPSRVTAADFVLIAWGAIYTLVLIAPVHEIYADYALPLVPPAAMLAGRGAGALTRWLGTIAGRPWLTTGALCLVVVSAELPLARKLIEQRSRYLARDVSSDQVQVANWLECRADASARIAYDHFVYVPPAFTAATVTWGGTRRWLSSLDPDIVIVNRSTADFASEQAENAEYYRCLAAGTCGYQRVLSRGDLTVYGKQGRLTELFAEPDARLGEAHCS